MGIRNFLENFEKTKTYPFSTEGFTKMKIDARVDHIGKYMSITFYAIVVMLLVKGVLGQQFITTYIAGNIGSKTVKYLMR